MANRLGMVLVSPELALAMLGLDDSTKFVFASWDDDLHAFQIVVSAPELPPAQDIRELPVLNIVSSTKSCGHTCDLGEHRVVQRDEDVGGGIRIPRRAGGKV